MLISCFYSVKSMTFCYYAIKITTHNADLGNKMFFEFNWGDKFDIIIKHLFWYQEIRTWCFAVIATRWKPNVKNESLTVEHQEKKHCAKLSWDYVYFMWMFSRSLIFLHSGSFTFPLAHSLNRFILLQPLDQFTLCCL